MDIRETGHLLLGSTSIAIVVGKISIVEKKKGNELPNGTGGLDECDCADPWRR